MEGTSKSKKVTVQGLNNPVPAASVDLLASHVPSSSCDREQQITTEVGTLASVADNASRVQTEVKEKDELRGGFKQPQPLSTGEGSDSESSNENNTTITPSRNDEVERMVEEVSDSIAKLSTTKKKPSGAQRRKRKRLNREPTLGQSQDKPKETSDSPSISEAKRIRSPEELNTENRPKKKKSSSSTDILKGPSHTSPKGVTSLNPMREADKVNSDIEKASTSAKSTSRQRASEKKPLPKRKRKLDVEKGKEPPSYAKVAKKSYRDDLCYAVYDAGNPTGKIKTDQYSKVEDLVNNKIVDHVIASKGKQPIECMSSEFSRGVMLMKLASQQCASTLRNLVESIPPPWDGAKLRLVKRRELPLLTKSTVYIKGWGSNLANERILEILGSQNAKLVVGKWEVFHRKEDPEGTLLVVGIDRDSMTSLTENKGIAYFASKTVVFKTGKMPLGRAVKSSPEEKTSTSAAPSATTMMESNPNGEEGLTITPSQEEKLLEGLD